MFKFPLFLIPREYQMHLLKSNCFMFYLTHKKVTQHWAKT